MNIQQALGNFDPATDLVVVRGIFNDWSGTNPTLTDTGDMLYAGSFDVDASFIGTDVEYKFVIVSATQGDIWESVDNRTFNMAGGAQTLDPVYFNNQDSLGELVNIEVLFRVNMEVSQASGQFDPVADWIVIRGGHANLGNWGGAVQLTPEGGNPGHYFLNVQFDNVEVGTDLEYKYVILENQNETTPIWESVPNRRVTVESGLPDSDSDGYGDVLLSEAFFNNTTWDDIIAQAVTVHFFCDIWPIRVWFEEHPGETNHGLNSFEEVTFVGICGPWNNWPWDLVPPQYQMVNPSGTMYEGQATFSQFSARDQTYKFGANGHDNEAGFQLDHVVTIDDSSPDFSVTNTFGELGDWWTTTDVAPRLAPADFALGEAWPNPFNPATTLTFSNRQAGELRLSVVNLAGQEVALLSEGLHAAGQHRVSFNAAGLSSGLYLAVLEGQGQRVTQKLMLVK
jgi:hypothetical protein